MSSLSLPLSKPSASTAAPKSQLVLLILICVIFVTVEGLLRGDSVVYADTGDLTVLAAGWIFALVSFPFVVLYARAARVSKSEFLLLWLILGTVVYTKDFAYTHIPGVPIYITDIVLALCAYWNRRSIIDFLKGISKFQIGALALFVAAGAISTLRGIAGGQDRMKVARDSELIVYTAFIFLGFVVFRSWPSIRRAATFFLIGSCLGALNAIMWFLGNPGARRYIPYPLYILAAFLALLILAMRRIRTPARLTLALLLGVGIVLADARTIYVSLAACLAVVVVIGSHLWRGAYLSILKPLISGVLIAALVLPLLYQTKTGSDFMNRNAAGLISGTLDYQNDPNASFRFLAWFEAYDRFIQQPVVGEGYGIPFIFELADNDSRPHNTFLTVLYKMGLLGFLPLTVFLAGFFFEGYRTLLQSKRTQAAVWLLVLLVAQLSYCMFGFLNLMLESPFLASMFWLFLGIGYSLMLQMKQYAALQTAHEQ